MLSLQPIFKLSLSSHPRVGWEWTGKTTALVYEVIAVIGYGVQGPGQACNLRDNGFNVIVGQRQGKTYDKAVADGWVPGKTLFSIEEAAEKGTILCMLLSDAGQSYHGGS